MAAGDAFAQAEVEYFVARDVAAWRGQALAEDSDLFLRGPNVLLVPYRREHVARYHAWMQVRLNPQSRPYKP